MVHLIGATLGEIEEAVYHLEDIPVSRLTGLLEQVK